jgi:transposase InsO family protein
VRRAAIHPRLRKGCCYLRLSILPDAAIVLRLLPAWFDDYNNVHAHSALPFQSPADFRRFSA